MPSLGNLWYTLGIDSKQLDADFKKINDKLKNAGSDLLINPKLAKSINEILPKGIKLELDPQLKAISNETLAKAAEGKVMRVEIMPLLTHLRKALKDATKDNPPEMEVGVQSAKLRKRIEDVLLKHGFMITVSTLNDNFTKVVQQKLNGTRYTVKIHADAAEITRSVQASLMQVQSRYFGLKVSRDILYRSIDEALGNHRFPIQIKVMQDQARKAVQDALLRAQVMGKDQALAYQRLQTGEMKAAQAELMRLKAAHMGAADAAKAHATASVNLGGAMGRNITIAGELGSAMTSIYSIHALKEFLSQVIEIGGELEHQKIAMDTIFGDKGKTGELFGQIKGLARQSPFGVMELTKSVKALSAYGVEYNEIYDTAKRLADISAATSVDINRLILAFGKTKSRGFLDGLEAKQFAYANIPIYEMVRKKLEELEGQAVTTQEVMERMRKREIGFDIVKDVLWDMTDEGGKFYNMQEALAGSVKTSWKLVRDNIELMFGEIAEGAIGERLKDVAEILQTLTRNWATLGSVIGIAALGMGVYKVAMLATNAVIDKSLVSTVKQNANLKMQRYHANLAALSYRGLTEAEEANYLVASATHKLTGLRIFTRKRLTEEEVTAMLNQKRLTKEQLLQLVALKKVTVADAERLLITKSTTAADAALIKAEIAKAAAAKRGTVIWMQMKAAMAGVLGTMKTLLFNPMTAIMVGLSAVVTLWQKNSEEMEKAKEIGDNIFTKASEGADNLKQKLAVIKPAEGLSSLEMERGIEDMIQTIKDYSPTPLKDINDALVAQDGHLLTIEERYEALRKKVEDLNAAYTKAEKGDFGGILKSAINDTSESWFNDDINKNLKDYSEALKRSQDRIREFSTNHTQDMRRAVDAALKADEGFRKATKGMQTYEEKFKELLSLNDEGEFKYQSSWYATRFTPGGIINRNEINAAYNEAVSDYNKFVNSIMTSLSQQGITDVSKLTDDMKGALAISFKSWLDGLDGVSNEVKNKFAGFLQKSFNVSLIEDDLTPQWVKAFQKLAKSSTDAATQQAVISLQTKGYNQLSAAEKKIIDDLIKQAGNDIAEQQPDLKNTVQAWFNSNPLMWQVTLQVQQTMQGGIEPLTRQLINARGGFSGKKSVLAILNRWGKAGDAFGMRNAAQQDLQAAENRFEAAKKFGESTEEYVNAKKNLDDINAALQYAKWEDIETKDQKSNKHSKSGSQKDEFAERLKQRFKDIKDAWSEFQKWSKTEGAEAAATRIGESGLFSTLPKDKIPQTVEQYRALVVELENELRSAGVKGTAREGLLNDLLKQLLDIDKTVVDEQLKLALDKVTKEAERQLENWNLYDKIHKATGDKQLAMNLAFGVGVEGQTDYESLIKDKFNAIAKTYKSTLTFDTATPELLAKAPEEVRKAWEQAYSEIRKYRDKEREEVADMVAQYRTTQEEIVALTAEAEEKKRKIRESKNLSPVEKKQITAKIDADLNYEVFRKSGEYLKFFNAILSMTGREAESVGRKIKEALDEQLKAGQISAKDYCDEMEKIDKQLEKIRQKQKGFGGLGSFAKGGLQQMFQDRYAQADSDYNAAIQNQEKAAEQRLGFEKQIAEFTQKGDISAAIQAETSKIQAEFAEKAATSQAEGAAAAKQGAQGAMQTMAVIDTIVHGINDTVQGIKGSFDLIADLADSMGIDTGADTDWGKAGAFLDAFSQASQHATDAWDSLKSGNVGGVIQGVIGSITSWFTTFNRWHDAKLQAQIEKSKQIVQNIQYAYDAIERRMGNFLGNAKNLPVFAIDEAKKELDDLDKDIQSKQDKLAKMDGFAAKGTAIGTTVGGALGGIFGAAIGGLAGGIADLVNHSKKKKLEKELNKLYEERARLVARIEAYQEGGALSLQRQMMKEQLEELEKQKKAEEGKKKVDKAAVKDYEDQIDELTVKIQEFGIEMAKEIYGIDLNSWAEQLGDALVDAFAAGEDAAEAFDNTVSDIMRSLVGKMLTQDLIAPMFDDVRDYLFGENGVYSKGATGGDFEMSEEDAIGLAEKLAGMKGIVEDAKTIYDQINAATDGMLDDKESKSGLSAGIQSVTEDTADLLASYLNAVRADVSIQTYELWPRLLDVALPQISVIAQSQLDAQRQIAENTLRAAKAAEAIVKSNDDISHLLVRVTQGGDKFYVR